MSNMVMTEGGLGQRGTQRGKGRAKPGDYSGKQYHKGHADAKENPLAYVADTATREIITSLVSRIDALEKQAERTEQVLTPTVNYLAWKIGADDVEELQAFVDWARNGYQGDFPVDSDPQPVTSGRRVRRTSEEPEPVADAEVAA